MPAKEDTSSQKANDAKNLFNKMASKKKPTPKAAAKPSRPEMELTPAMEQMFIRFIGAYAVAEEIGKRADQEKANLDEGCLNFWIDRLWKQRSRPANPEIKIDKHGTLDMRAIFQVRDYLKIELPEIPDDKDAATVAAEQLTDVLVGTGMDEDEAAEAAKNLVANELDFTPSYTADFNKLMFGHYEGDGRNKTFIEATSQEQALANKAVALWNARTKEDLEKCETLTDEECERLFVIKFSAVVKKGFFDRVCTYVKTVEQLRAIFKIIRPSRFPSHMKFAASDTNEERNRRLAIEALDILGNPDLKE